MVHSKKAPRHTHRCVWVIVSAESISEGPREPTKDDTFRQWKQFSGHDTDLQLFKTCENGAFWTF